MAIQHARAGEKFDVKPLGEEIASTKTHSLVKTDSLELIRLVLPAGKDIAEHRAPGEITVQCLEGLVEFSIGEKTHRLAAGEMLYLDAKTPHALHAVEDSSVLVTLLLEKKG
jgi:quercetin dioxygenase-like cupin family protein